MDKEKGEGEGEKSKKMEVDDSSKKNDPALPPNYVSLVVLQERWLQRKQQEKEERQKPQLDSKSRDDVKQTTKGFSKTPQNRGPRIEGRHVSDNQVVRSRFKGNVSAGFPRVNGMAKNVNQRGIGEGNYRKIIHGVEFDKGRMGGGKGYGFGKFIEEKDCSRSQGKNLSFNAGVRGAASVFMVREVPEILSKEIKPVELISKSDAKTVIDRDNLRKNVSCNAAIEGRANVFRVEAKSETVSKQIKPGEFSRHVDGKTVQDRGNVRKNLSCNSGDDEGTVSVFMVEAVPEISSKEIKLAELIRKSDVKPVHDKGNVRKNLSCNSGDEGTASVSMVETVPGIVSKEIKPAELISKSDGKTDQDKGNVRKNLSCNSGIEGTVNVFMGEAVPGIVSKEIKHAELISKSDGKTVEDKGNVRKNLSCNSGVEGTASVSLVETVPGIVSKEMKPAELINKSDGKTDQDKGNVRKSLSCNSGVEGTENVAVPEIGSKEIKPVEWIRKSDGKRVKDNLRKNANWRVKSSGRKSEVEELPENTMKKEDLGVLVVENAPINGDDEDCVVEVLLENKEKEGALLGHGKGSERIGGEVERKRKKKTRAKKLSDSKDKNTPEETMEKGTEDEVLTGDNGSSLQKGTRGRKFQRYRHRESIAENLGTKIRRNFRDLSFVERRGNFNKYPRYQVMQKPAVWVKRGEISAANVDESGNSGPLKLESTGTDEGEKEAEARSADLNSSS